MPLRHLGIFLYAKEGIQQTGQQCGGSKAEQIQDQREKQCNQSTEAMTDIKLS